MWPRGQGSWLRGLRGLLARRQLRVDVVAGLGLACGGDVICQLGIERVEVLDWRRTAAVSTFGGFYTGLICHFVYPMYPVWARLLAPSFSRTTVGQGVLCTAIDNGVHSPLFYIPAFYLYTGLWQGKSLAESTTHLRQDYLSITSSCWALWVPVQLVNFSLVPPQHRVVFVNTWNLVWNTVMDYIAHNDTATIIMQREEIKSRLMARLGLGGGPAE